MSSKCKWAYERYYFTHYWIFQILNIKTFNGINQFNTIQIMEEYFKELRDEQDQDSKNWTNKRK